MLRSENARPVLLKNYKPVDYLIKTVDLNFDLDPEKTIVTATINFSRNKNTKAGASLVLDGDGIKLLSLKLDGKDLGGDQYTATPDRLTIHKVSRNFSLEITTVVNPTANTALSGLYRSNGNYCTQCEAEGFRRITYFLDRPDVLAVYTTRIVADQKSSPILLGNGNPQKKGKLKDGRHYAVWHDPHPKPSYLFALVAGDLGAIFKNYKTNEGRKVRLGIYVEKGKEPRAHYAMDALIRSMRWDEEVFGCAYDLDVFNIVAVSDFNMGAMENKGLNIFNDKYVLADDNSATDVDFARIEAIIAHEYFHNWTGNRITCRDWFQLCLKEGLTVYRDQEFSSDMRSRAVKRIADVALLRAHQFPEDQGPLAHSVRPSSYREINNFYTATIYEKGAEIVRMIATLLGNKKFAKGISLYLKRHDGDAATIEDFLKCFADATKIDLEQFSLWYSQAGTPHLHVSTRYNAAKQSYSVEIEQSQSATPGQSRKRPLHMPVRIGLVGEKGDLKFSNVAGAEHHGDVFELTKRKHKITFSGISERPVLSFNRNFSAPVEVNYRHSDKELMFLAEHDTDAFNRWQALRTFASKQIISAMRSSAKRKKPTWQAGYLNLVAQIAADETLEPAFRNACLTLPSENDIAQMLSRNIDPDAIHRARKGMQNAIGESLSPSISSIIIALDIPTKFVSDADGAGKRAFKNTLLNYGLNSDDESFEKLVIKQFKTATNMSDREAAFNMILRNIDDEKITETTLKTFYNRYKNDPIIMDKWFTAQAMVTDKTTLTNVKKLTRHKDFSWTNPNRMRSLIGAFASGNAIGFNRKDGSGYKFVADAVKKLDGMNPQIAARLLTAFRSWKMLEPNRRKLAHTALKQLSKTKGLSRDVSDILDRTIA